jgi:hypothetical protein
VADALRKAELYARAAGVTLGHVAWITEDSRYVPPAWVMAAPARTAAPAAEGTPTPISVGEHTLRARITIGFDIAN